MIDEVLMRDTVRGVVADCTLKIEREFSELCRILREELSRPSLQFRPKIRKHLHGPGWSAEYHDVFVFGSSPEEAAANFDREWRTGK